MKFTRILFTIILLLLIAGCEKQKKDDITSISQLNDSKYTIGYAEGQSAYDSLKKILPNAKLRSFSSQLVGYEAVKQKKIDAFAYDRLHMEMAQDEGLDGVQLLNENLDKPISLGVAISPVSEIPDLKSKINSFLAETHSDGTIDDMKKRWHSGQDEMPQIPVPEKPRYHLTVGTTGIVPPYSYYKGTQLAGFDIEMAQRFAYWLDADVEFKIYDYGSIIAAALSGEIDCIMANLNVTPERQEKIEFSDTIYETTNTIMVHSSAPKAEAAKNLAITSVSQLNDSRYTIGYGEGHSAYYSLKEALPKAKLRSFASVVTGFEAVRLGKIDAYAFNRIEMEHAIDAGLSGVHLLEEDISEPVDIAVGISPLSKIPDLEAKINAFIDESHKNGLLSELFDRWNSENPEMPDIPAAKNPKFKLCVGTTGQAYPYSYYKGTTLTGLDIELARRFALWLGASLEFETYDFGGVVTAAVSGSVDCVMSNLNATKERREMIPFSDTLYRLSNTLMVRDSVAKTESKGFLSSLAKSFERTFVRENRWKLIVNGIKVTVVISILSALFGSILGFVICGLRMSGNKILNGIALTYIRVMQGMPMVVLLMILFYVVFAKTEIPDIAVAVIGFGMNFAAYVSEMIRTGILAVDKGQMEAALALGYTKPRAFIKVVLPQASRHFIPVFQGEFISLVKITSVVGYIAIHDLTKAGDIIRSRTYEAFFPLIITAVIYFVISWILTRLLVSIQNHLDTKKRRDKKLQKNGCCQPKHDIIRLLWKTLFIQLF